jgi:hypothetical protein
MAATFIKQDAYFTSGSVYAPDDSNNVTALNIGLPLQAANNCKSSFDI